MPQSKGPKKPSVVGVSDAGILLDQPRVLGVDPLDPAGTLPADAKLNGITVIFPRWPDFPVGTRVHTVNIYIVGIVSSVAQRDYRAADAAPEFFLSIDAASLPNTPSFEIFYTVRTPNPTTSPRRLLTFKVAQPPVVLKEPVFIDADLWGYIICDKRKVPPPLPDALFVWEGIRVVVPFDDRFQENDVIELEWQGWKTLTGAPPAAMNPVTFSAPITAADIQDKNDILIVIEPFDRYIKPMTDNDSATATYTLFRNGIPEFMSKKGTLKIDRKISGAPGFCDGPREIN